MKKIIKYILIFLLCLTYPKQIKANDFEGKESEYNSQCSKPSEENSAVCKQYQEYLKAKKKDFNQKIKELKDSLSDIATNIQKAIDNAKVFQVRIDKLRKEIDILNQKIEESNKQIKLLEKNIDLTTSDIRKLKDRVFKRMVLKQTSMHFNPYIEFIMGARNFEDLIIRTNGLKAIMKHDNKVNDRLKALLEKLRKDKDELEKAKQALDKNKKDLEAKEADLIEQKTYFDVLKIELVKKQEDLRAQLNQTVNNLDSIKNSIGKVGSIETSSSWGQVVNGDWFRSAGTWYYDEGGRHLGLDMAAKFGTPLMSPGNGVVLQSYNGCANYGYLGNSCGELGYLGNQIRLVLSVDDKLYGVTIGHLKLDTVISAGTVVEKGQYIGEVGSSGSSTGPHAHVEVVYLGNVSDYSSDASLAIEKYVESWDGHLSFGTDRFSSTFMQFACEVKGSAPCRLRPETIWGDE